jgi:hypothetical protein
VAYGESVLESLSLSREIVRPLALALAAVFLSVTAAWAIDCTTGGRTNPWTPDEVDSYHQALVEYQCCCWYNVISAWGPDPILVQENKCCDAQDDNCDNYWQIIYRSGTAAVNPDALNHWDNGHATWQRYSKLEIYLVCICSGGPAIRCERVLEQQAWVYDFNCDPCPW